jgi:hypothetical protein
LGLPGDPLVWPAVALSLQADRTIAGLQTNQFARYHPGSLKESKAAPTRPHWSSNEFHAQFKSGTASAGEERAACFTKPLSSLPLTEDGGGSYPRNRQPEILVMNATAYWDHYQALEALQRSLEGLARPPQFSSLTQPHVRGGVRRRVAPAATGFRSGRVRANDPLAIGVEELLWPFRFIPCGLPFSRTNSHQ